MRLIVIFLWLVTTAFAIQTAAESAEERIADLQARLRSDASWADGWQQLGILLADGGRYREARPCFEKLAALRPEGGDGRRTQIAPSRKPRVCRGLRQSE